MVCTWQGYGSTETGRISWTIGPDECSELRCVGRLSQNIEARIVDIVTRQPLSVGQQGELCIRSPTNMIGNFNNIMHFPILRPALAYQFSMMFFYLFSLLKAMSMTEKQMPTHLRRMVGWGRVTSATSIPMDSFSSLTD